MFSTNVKTTSDLMSIALQAEREAIRRYSQLALEMHKADNEPTAALFERMVREEQEHERLLNAWMLQEGITENTGIKPIRWSDPHVATIYNEEAHDPFVSSPYKALAFAVHNEEIAFRFYTHVAANSENKTVRQYAEVLAKEELGHAALLRAERRYAYHAERKSTTDTPRLDPKAIHSKADLLAAAIHVDSYIVEQIKELSTSAPEINSLAEKTQQQISENQHALADTLLPSKEITTNLKQLALYNKNIKQKDENPNLNLQRLWSCCDRSFAFYDAIVEEAVSEEVMLAAQKLTASALNRIGILKEVLKEE